jgi:predicted nucleotidyltransferase
MILGYNQARPTRKDYAAFMKNFTKELESHESDSLSLMTYGSYVRGDYVPGRSDIDAVLVLPNSLETSIINEDIYAVISEDLCGALTRNYVPFQVSVLDPVTLRDGRFNPFTADFHGYFKSEGRVVLGPDYRDEMVCLPTKSGPETTIGHNLRKTRQALLFSEYDRRNDYEKFLKGFTGTLNAATQALKQILYLIDGKVRGNRFSTISEISRHFNDDELEMVDIETLEEIRHLFSHPKELDKIYKDSDEVLSYWYDATFLFECLIGAYIEKFPRSNSNTETTAA